MYLYEKFVRELAVRVRLRGRDRVVPVPAHRRDLARQLPAHPQDQVGGVLGMATVATTRRPRRARRRLSMTRRFQSAGPFTYLFLLVVAILSFFPLYWSVVVASHDNSAIAAYPPVMTPGQQLFHNIGRVFNSGEVSINFWTALINSAIVSARRRSRSSSSARSPASRSPSSSSAGTSAVARRDRNADRPGPARRDPALHRDEAPRLDQPPPGGDRTVARLGLRRVPHAAVHRRRRPERAHRRLARGRLQHDPASSGTSCCPRSGPRRRCSGCSRS